MHVMHCGSSTVLVYVLYGVIKTKYDGVMYLIFSYVPGII